MRKIILLLILLVLVGGCREEKSEYNGYDEWGDYHDKMSWDSVCWVKALDKLNELRNDPEVNNAKMVFGTYKGNGHAWIQYEKYGETRQYDPTNMEVDSSNWTITTTFTPKEEPTPDLIKDVYDIYENGVSNLCFSAGKGQVKITWADEKLDVIYDNTNITESAKVFFEFLKDYINEGYTITEKQKENACPVCGSVERTRYWGEDTTENHGGKELLTYICAICGNVYAIKAGYIVH